MKYNLYKHKNWFFLTIFYFLAVSIGFFILKDYGVHIEEKYHRLNGHYWLNYIAKIFYLENLQLITENKISNISDYTLSPITGWANKWGVVLDVPVAFLEIALKLEDIRQVYYLKHYLSYLIFLTSSFFFFKIIDQRYKKTLLSIIGLILYITTPRIFGDSFLYKDVLYLSFFTISLFFLLESLKKFQNITLIMFALFLALSFNLKFFTILIPIIFGIILIIQNFYERKNKFFLKKFFFFTFFFLLFVYIFWPYLWSDPIRRITELFFFIKQDLTNVKLLYANEYISNRFLPSTYLFKWMFVSSPIFQNIIFILGLFFCLTRLIKRFIKIEENNKFNDLWRSNSEKKDFIFLIILIGFLSLFIFFNAPFYNGWRLVYFLNFFVIYFGLNFLNNFFLIYRKKKNYKIFLKLIISISIFFNFYYLVIYHPFQSVYFNNFLGKKIINGFEGDYYGLSSKHFFNEIIRIDNNSDIKIAVASHTPLHRGLEAFPDNIQNKFTIVGQEYEKADYIYKNNISEVNPTLNNKYKIPKNFSKIYELNIRKLLIYEIYKKH